MVEVSLRGQPRRLFPGPQHGSDRVEFADAGTAEVAIRASTSTTPPTGRCSPSQISSAAVQARFPQFALVPVNGTLTVPSVYPGFPGEPAPGPGAPAVPQWGGVSPWLGPPMGKTWYDSMQVKVTKRYSHGLQAAGNFTWAKGNVIGSASDSTYFLGRPGRDHGHLQLQQQQTAEPVRQTSGDDDHIQLYDAEVRGVQASG